MSATRDRASTDRTLATCQEAVADRCAVQACVLGEAYRDPTAPPRVAADRPAPDRAVTLRLYTLTYQWGRWYALGEYDGPHGLAIWRLDQLAEAALTDERVTVPDWYDARDWLVRIPPLTGPDLRALRERLGLSQAGLAEALGPGGPDWSTIAQWEQGVRPIRWPRLWQLALTELLRRRRT